MMAHAHRHLIIRALRSHSLECVDKAMQARAAGDLDGAGQLAEESIEAQRLAAEMESVRAGIDSNGRFEAANRHERVTTGVDRRAWFDRDTTGFNDGSDR
jgi:hypothetical protein